MEVEVWDEMSAAERRIDDLFRAFLGPRARFFFPVIPSAWHRPFVPPADVFVRKGDLVVRFELPGIDPAKDVKITIQDGTLVVSGERKKKEEIKNVDYYRMEASYGTFQRHVQVPEGIDEKKILAEYKDGVLEVLIPAGEKAISGSATAIPIKTAA